VGSILGGKFKENILEAQIDALQLKQRPPFFDDPRGHRAANIFSLGCLDRRTDAALHRRRFHLNARRTRNLR
jgi:hypothetical protein